MKPYCKLGIKKFFKQITKPSGDGGVIALDLKNINSKGSLVIKNDILSGKVLKVPQCGLKQAKALLEKVESHCGLSLELLGCDIPKSSSASASLYNAFKELRGDVTKLALKAHPCQDNWIFGRSCYQHGWLVLHEGSYYCFLRV
jgi:hypothetical protein